MLGSLVENAAFITLLLTGALIWIIGVFMTDNLPQKINHIYGYRSRRSKQSQEAWDFAQAFAVEHMIKAAQFMCLLSIIFLLIPLNETTGSLLATFIIIFLLFRVVFYTEKELREKF